MDQPPLPPPSSSLEEFNRFAKAEAPKVYAALETLLKRHQPDVWGPFAARRLREAWKNPDVLLAQTPPHFLLNSIEANCAYVRSQNQDPVDLRRLLRVMAVYVNRVDPMQLYLSANELHHFVIVLAREQLELQVRHSARHVARLVELFSSKALPLLSEELKAQHGLTTDQWIRVAYGVFAQAFNTENGCIWKQPTMNYATTLLQLSKEGVESFFRLSSRTPKEIGERYRKLRAETQPQFHSLIRTVFLEAPLIDFGDGRLLAPDADLVFRNCGEGLYRILKLLPGFDDEFGKSVQRYVEKLLSCVTGKILLLRNADLERYASGKSCDCLLETTDCIFLVESKATTLRADILIEKVLIKDGSTNQVSKGLVQLNKTADDIHAGAFQALGVDATKPIVGMVSTFGDIPFANSDWYFDTCYRKRAEEKIGHSVDRNLGLSERPAVVSLPTLEMVVTALEYFKISPLTLFHERAAHSYMTLGEWDGYLRNKLSQAGATCDPLPFVTEETNAFYTSMGAGEEDVIPTTFKARAYKIIETRKS